ncbi:MAG: large conductance mechanosensitive channel protein MscL [Gemmataceae bacterium]|nr:large conductance mechanosensitive channel protein MscL [Gemmataceae bacterium]
MVPTTKVLSLFDEFKKFALKGNVIDMAIGVIIGTAFTKVVDSLVKSVMMPLINVFLPGTGAWAEWAPEIIPGKPVPFGLFISEVVNFLIIALVLYVFAVKFLGWILDLHKQESAAPPEPPADVKLLTEIRDLLKAKAQDIPSSHQ